MTVHSRESIAQLASKAAVEWHAEPEAPKPVNPFCAHEQPDHHAEWERRFQIALLRVTAPESAEASA